MSGTFAADPVETVTKAMTEGEVVQNVNFSDVEIAGVLGLIEKFVDVERNASLETGDYLAMSLASEQLAITHGATAENAGDMNVYTANASAADTRTNEAIEHGVKSNAAAATAAEAGAKAAALVQASNITQAQIQQEMRLHSVLEEETIRKAAAATLDLEAEAATASVDKDALQPLKLT